VGGAQPGQDLGHARHPAPASSDEFPLWQAARSTTRLWEAGAWQRGFGVALGELGRLNDAVAQALDGQLLTREELADRVGELTGSELLGDKLRESWGALLKPAAALGLVCFAPSRGQQVRFTRPDIQGQAAARHHRAVRRPAARPGPPRRRGRGRTPGRLVGRPARAGLGGRR
jgi:hypothetical protein